MLVVPNEGERRLLLWMLKATFLGTGSEEITEEIEIGLFKNDFEPHKTMTVASFVEADFVGYARGVIARTDWTDPVTPGSGDDEGKAVMTAPDEVFASSDASPQELFGYFVLDPADDTVLWAERFVTSRTIEDTQTITIRPKFTGQCETDVLGT